MASGWLLAAGRLQDEACQVSGGRVSQSIGGGLPSQQRFKGFKLFKGLERLEGLRAGKRQAWTPRRSHGCVALGCLLAADEACQGIV